MIEHEHKLHFISEDGAEWVVYRCLADQQWPNEPPQYVQHIETATEAVPLYCVYCPTRLNANGTTTPMMPVPQEVTDEHPPDPDPGTDS